MARGLEYAYYWIIHVGDARFALHPILVLLGFCLLPLLAKGWLSGRLGVAGQPYWFYAVDISLIPVVCTGCELFGVTEGACDSYIASNLVLCLMVFGMSVIAWGFALLLAVLAAAGLLGWDDRVRAVVAFLHFCLAGTAVLLLLLLSFGGPAQVG